MESGLIAARLMAFAIDGVDPGLDKNTEIAVAQAVTTSQNKAVKSLALK